MSVRNESQYLSLCERMMQVKIRVAPSSMSWEPLHPKSCHPLSPSRLGAMAFGLYINPRDRMNSSAIHQAAFSVIPSRQSSWPRSCRLGRREHLMFFFRLELHVSDPFGQSKLTIWKVWNLCNCYPSILWAKWPERAKGSTKKRTWRPAIITRPGSNPRI